MNTFFFLISFCLSLVYHLFIYRNPQKTKSVINKTLLILPRDLKMVADFYLGKLLSLFFLKCERKPVRFGIRKKNCPFCVPPRYSYIPMNVGMSMQTQDFARLVPLVFDHRNDGNVLPKSRRNGFRRAFELLAAEADVPLFIPEENLTTDNALMIAVAGFMRLTLKNGSTKAQKGELAAKGNLAFDKK